MSGAKITKDNTDQTGEIIIASYCMEIFFGDHDQPIWGNAQLASSGNPTFWDTRFALETTGKKQKHRPTNREHRWYSPDKSWGDDCSWVDFGYVFAMLQRLLHFQQWKRPWPEVYLAVWRWENHTTKGWTVGWCSLTGFLCRYLKCLWKIPWNL